MSEEKDGYSRPLEHSGVRDPFCQAIDKYRQFYEREPEFAIALTALVVITVLYLLVLAPLMRFRSEQMLEAATAELRQRTHEIQIALERYCSDNEDGAYPESFDVLVKLGYLSALPDNPYYGLVEGAPEKMVQLRVGEFKPGGVVYLYDKNRMQYSLVSLGYWVAGRPDDVAAIRRYAVPLESSDFYEASGYLWGR